MLYDKCLSLVGSIQACSSSDDVRQKVNLKYSWTHWCRVQTTSDHELVEGRELVGCYCIALFVVSFGEK